eukprot:CAMPEP_0176057824 /NCGR_PEP_ID=MMETSP0120_2-20121206/28803_1 /TAXON_ID=160619 /ORGANISM="Kryptoperidinium foliaceum, Strain CCMP 1326" /LENGTH=255 /DNA_ID=CAMNT_0017391339 /DNA_START=85 /DNA_END=849 /DNA_ORIENTATION=+
MARQAMQGKLWVNDPDCLILREEAPIHEARAFASVVALSGGSLVLSDDVDHLPWERLDIFKRLVPPLPASTHSTNLLVEGLPDIAVVTLPPSACGQISYLIGVFNWTDGDDSRLVHFDFADLSQAHAQVAEGSRLWNVFDVWEESASLHEDRWSGSVMPRGCRLLAARRRTREHPQYIGSDIHVSCGLEVCHFSEVKREAQLGGERSLDFAIDAGRSLEAPCVWLHLPGSCACELPRYGGAGTWAIPLPSFADAG